MGNAETTGKKPDRPADVYQLVTDKIIIALEQGIVPWRKTWKGSTPFPQNYATGHVYRGINAVIAGVAEHPYPFFLTFKQTQALGGSIKKGAWSIPIVFWKVIYKDEDGKTIPDDVAPGPTATKLFFPKYYRVFNIGDVDGIDFVLPEETKNDFEPIISCETVVKHMPRPPIIRVGGDKASYSPPIDIVRIPKLESFDTPENYYATLFHELIHSTGHDSRLNREEVMKRVMFGSCDYSKEELTAEMGSAFLCAITGIDQPELMDNAAAYIQSWLKELENDKRFVFRAAMEAKKAVEYISPLG